MVLAADHASDVIDGGVDGSSPLGNPVGVAIKRTLEMATDAVSGPEAITNQTENTTTSNSNINPELNEGQQGKHIPGHNKNDPGRSQIGPGIDPGELVAGAANGDYPQVGTSGHGDPVFDFGKVIGTDASSGEETPYGTVHSGKKGSHIVPANPKKYKADTEVDQEESHQEGGGQNDDEATR
ncbi:MAG: hypothetical protein KDE03_14425 [Rhodobacteraceae bacterium]|nr:hypothetical protein [Paracoccaceae bacterium]